MQLLETRTLYANPDPLLVSRQAAFPGLIRLPDGKLYPLTDDANDVRLIHRLTYKEAKALLAEASIDEKQKPSEVRNEP